MAGDQEMRMDAWGRQLTRFWDSAQEVYKHPSSGGILYQGGHIIAEDEEQVRVMSVRLVVNCTMNLPKPAWCSSARPPAQWLRFQVTRSILVAPATACASFTRLASQV